MQRLNRRQLFQAASTGLFCGSVSGWLPMLAAQLAADPRRRRHCVLLWMTGGPSQTDTFDMKPEHANGGQFSEIATSVPGLHISEHLPQLARQADRLAIIRGLSTKEGDHGRGTYLMRTGHQPMGPIQYPTIGASLSKQLKDESVAAPGFVSIAPYRAFNQAAYGPGFLGPKFAPLTVGATDNSQTEEAEQQEGGYAALKVDDLRLSADLDPDQFQHRLQFWRALQEQFMARHRTSAPAAHHTVYQQALRLVNSKASQAFDLTEEPDDVRRAYGPSRFGQGCLMARRLIEQGVAFVEVSLGQLSANSVGWDTHQDNFSIVQRLSAQLDAGWSVLMKELADRGLLEQTTIIWMGEFGRTPQINDQGGRDHYPQAWTCVLAGGGIQGGQAYGATSDDGTEVVDGKVDVGDVLASLCVALGVSPDTENIPGAGRPIPLAEGKPIREILATG